MDDKLIKKIEKGLAISYEKMVQFKKYKNTPIISMRDGKIVEIDPHSVDIDKLSQK